MQDYPQSIMRKGRSLTYFTFIWYITSKEYSYKGPNKKS